MMQVTNMLEIKESKNLASYLPEMLTGEELEESLSYLPDYHANIREDSQAIRLMALNNIYSIYVPSVMSMEIYSKLYLAMLRSLQKKGTRLAVKQQNENGKLVQKQRDNVNNTYSGIIGGSDSFTIIGSSGIGKSSAITRAIQLISNNQFIEIEEPFCKIIPCVIVQCPYDCSVKSLLLQILRQVDEEIDSNYYEKAVKARATTDMLIGSVSQVALNHVGLLVVDEIQNIVRHKNGMQLIGMLTQLINNSGISICMVGIPECEIFFEKVNYLARRALGLKYCNCEYDVYFRRFCEVLFSYRYVKNETKISDAIIQWLYEHSGGVISTIVSLIHDAQEIAILTGKEELTLVTLNEAYQQRMGMMHIHIQPSITAIKQTSIKKRKSSSSMLKENVDIMRTETAASKKYDFDIPNLVAFSKANNLDIVELLKEKIAIVEVTV